MVSTLNGQELTVTLTDSATFINNAMVTLADIPADNGVVHVIDAVLVPTCRLHLQPQWWTSLWTARTTTR